MAELSPEAQTILDILESSQEERLEETRSERLAPVYQRLGMRSGQVGRAEQEAAGEMERQLSNKEMQMLLDQLKRQRQLEDVESQREFKEQMTYDEWEQQEKMLGQRQEGQMELQELRGEQQMDVLDRKEEMAAKQREREKDQLIGNIISRALGGAAGFALGGPAGAAAGLGGKLGAFGVQQASQDLEVPEYGGGYLEGEDIPTGILEEYSKKEKVPVEIIGD